MDELILILLSFAAIGILNLFLGASAMQTSYDSEEWSASCFLTPQKTFEIIIKP